MPLKDPTEWIRARETASISGFNFRFLLQCKNLDALSLGTILWWVVPKMLHFANKTNVVEDHGSFLSLENLEMVKWSSQKCYVCINCIKYKHGTFRSWRHRIFYDSTKNKPRSARYASVAARSRPGIIAGATGGVSRVGILRFFRNTQKLSRWSMIRKKCLNFPEFFQNWWIIHFLCFFKVDCAIQLASRLFFPKVALSLTAG